MNIAIERHPINATFLIEAFRRPTNVRSLERVPVIPDDCNGLLFPPVVEPGLMHQLVRLTIAGSDPVGCAILGDCYDPNTETRTSNLQ